MGVNDIAIIRVKNSTSSSSSCLERAVWPACLPTPGEEFSTGLMSGWGKLGDTQDWSRLLRAAPVDIVNAGACNTNVRLCLVYSSIFLTSNFQLFSRRAGVLSVSPGQVCAGDLSLLRGACSGDSGGPLVGRDTRGRWAAVGLVSWRLAGPGCDGASYTVFTRISHYLPWIAQQMDLLPPRY